MEHAEKEAKMLNNEIAQRIRRIRQNKGWSLAKLAEKTGFTKSYLSQIENGKKEPPISTLTRIAHAFEEDVISLITGEKLKVDNEPFIIVRANERKVVTRQGVASAYTYESLNYKKKDRLMHAYILTSGFKFPEEPLVHEGEEFVYMLEGKQEVFYDGKTYIVGQGDCFYFESNRPHYGRSIGDIPAKFILVYSVREGK